MRACASSCRPKRDAQLSPGQKRIANKIGKLPTGGWLGIEMSPTQVRMRDGSFEIAEMARPRDEPFDDAVLHDVGDVVAWTPDLGLRTPGDENPEIRPDGSRSRGKSLRIFYPHQPELLLAVVLLGLPRLHGEERRFLERKSVSDCTYLIIIEAADAIGPRRRP